MATDKTSLAAQVESIRSREELVEFIRDLHRDLLANPENWDNSSLEAFLEALAAWVEDMDGFYRNRGQLPPVEPSWRDVGSMLLSASLYE